jgi:hypothetical protein
MEQHAATSVVNKQPMITSKNKRTDCVIVDLLKMIIIINNIQNCDADGGAFTALAPLRGHALTMVTCNSHVHGVVVGIVCCN